MTTSRLKRTAVLAYGFACYSMFLGVFLYAIGFIGNFLTPTTLDAPRQGSQSSAILVNLALLAAFALQHSGMARPAFKRWWTKFVPKVTERSTYVLFSNIGMIAMFCLWQPMGGVIWNIEHGVARGMMYGLFAIGWGIVLYATFLINHFDLFGLRQVWLYFRARPYTPLEFRVPSLYRHIRHPLYLGWLTVFWAAPTMTISHLLFAVVTTAYIVVAVYFEERDLIAAHGQDYVEYKRRTPMLIPRFRKSEETP